MTQIQKAFEAGVKTTAVENFKKLFHHSLNENAEKTLAAKIAEHHFPSVLGKNIYRLTPENSLETLAQCVEASMEDIFREVCVHTKNLTHDNAFAEPYQQTIKCMGNEEFEKARDTIIADWLKTKGSPKEFFIVTQKIFEAMYAKALLNKLIEKAAQYEAQTYVSLMDSLSDETVQQTLVDMLDLSRKNTYAPFSESFSETVVYELISVYRGQNKDAALLKTKKKVLSALINHLHTY